MTYRDCYKTKCEYQQQNIADTAHEVLVTTYISRGATHTIFQTFARVNGAQTSQDA